MQRIIKTLNISNLIILVCIPFILLAEKNIIPISESIFHVSQFIACFISLMIGIFYLIKYKKDDIKLFYYVFTSTILIVLWFSFILYIVITFDLSDM